VISEIVLRISLPFSTSYLCELVFSARTEIKTPEREALKTTDEEMRVAQSTVSPRISLLFPTEQAQISH
jgi:hypothetical protein